MHPCHKPGYRVRQLTYLMLLGRRPRRLSALLAIAAAPVGRGEEALMPQDRQHILTIHLDPPLPLEFAGELIRVIGEVGERFYDDVVARAADNGDLQCLVGQRKERG